MPWESSPLIAPLVPDQAEAASQLIARTIRALDYYNERAQCEEIAKYTAEHLIELASREADGVLIAVQQDDVVGFCISHYDDGVVWLDWIGVAAKFRRHGLAELLLSRLEQSLAGRHAHKIWCDTRTANVAAQQLFRNRGYRQITTLTNHWYGHDYYLWEKVIG